MSAASVAAAADTSVRTDEEAARRPIDADFGRLVASRGQIYGRTQLNRTTARLQNREGVVRTMLMDMDVADEGNQSTAKANRRDKLRKQRNAFGDSSVDDRSSLKCCRTDCVESSSFEALFFEPRLRRHCSEKGKSSSRSSSSSSTRPRSSRRRGGDAPPPPAPGAPGDPDDVDDAGPGRCNRSLSCRSRAPLRPTELNFAGAEPRRRTYSMPSKNKRAFIDAHHQRQQQQQPDPVHHQRSSSSSSTPDDFYRVRTFSTSSKGIQNRGDSFKRKRRAAAEAEKRGQTTEAATGREAKAKKPVPAVTSAGAVGRSLLLSTTVSAEKSRVLVMGGPGVGKRSIMQQFLTSEYMGTADSSHEDSGSLTVSVVVDEVEASLDLVHHPSGLATLPHNDRADAYCIVYSISDRDSFLHARELLSEIRKKSLQRQAAQILVANKADLVRQRQVAEDEGKLMAARYRGKFVEVSAVLNHKIDDLLVGIVRQIQLKRSGDDRKAADDSGCYPARELVDLILGKQRRVFNSCDNLLVL